MWFGTGDGLNRFDGYTFRIFRNDPQNPNSLSNNFITSIFEDRSGALWIGTNDGLNLFNRQSESFTRYQNNPQNPNSLSSNAVFSIYEARSGALWIGTGNGLSLFDRRSQSFTCYQHDPQDPNSLSNNTIASICEDRSGALWIGTNDGLSLFDRRSQSFTRYRHDPQEPNSLSNNTITSICEDRSDGLWIGTDNGLNLFDRQSKSFTRYQHDPQNPSSLSTNAVSSICEDRSGALWIGTYEGLNLFDRHSKSFTRYQYDPQNPMSWVWVIYEDRSGALWIGTRGGGGLNLFDRQSKSFTRYRNDPKSVNSLSNNSVRPIHEDRSGALWIGTENGLNLFDRQSQSFTRYQNDPQNPSSLSTNHISSICEDRFGALWIGTGNGLNLFDRRSQSFTRYKTDPQNPRSLSNNFVWFIYGDRSGAMWIGTNDGLNLFDHQSRSFTRYRRDPQDSNSLSNNNVTSIYEDRSGALWIGTRGGGLNLFNRTSKSFTRYQNDTQNPNSLSSNLIGPIYEDHAGAVWIGTFDGLNLFDRASGVFKHFREKDGLPNNVVYGILEDGSGRLWLSTNKGISQFDPRTGEFRNYDASDGLTGNEFNVGAYCKTHDGMMYFGSVNGVTAFHPDSIRDNPYVPPVVITDLLLFNKPVEVGADYEGFVLPQSVTTADEVVLSYRETVFALEFSALCFVSPGKHKYAYRLEGFDKGWMATDARKRFATYTNLDAGTYVFRVKGSNHDGFWNEEGRSLRIIITPPWWKSTWAYSAYAVLIGLMLYSIRRYEMNRLGWKHRMQLEHVLTGKMKEVDQMKSRFFANISHEFRTPLTLILGPIQKWKAKAETGNSPDLQVGDFKTPSQKLGEGFQPLTNTGELQKDLGMAERNAHRLLRLINQLLDLSKLEAGGMKLQAAQGNIVPFVKGIAQSFQSSAGRRSVALNVETEGDEIEAYFDRDKLEKILTNLLSNAFKFTPEGGSVAVSIQCHAERSEESRAAPNTGRDDERSRSMTQAAHDTLRLRPAQTTSGAALRVTREGYVTITVSDTGIGIPADQLDKIFDRFYQVDASQTREQEGTGIGLALTKELVELHHGTISVRSEVGKGTEFTVRLPLGREHFKDAEVVEAIGEQEGQAVVVAAVEATHESPLRVERTEVVAEKSLPLVLIIEDNADVRAYMKEYLITSYQVFEAHDGAEGIEKAKETIPDLIISDVMMPKKDGYELCKTLKLDEKTSHIPIILLTAKAGTESKIEGLETGADDYVTKPFDAKELLVRVKNLIELRRKLRERFSKEQVLRPGEIAVTSIDDAFLQKVRIAVEQHIGEEGFGVEELAREVNMSRSQLLRKLTALTGLSVRDFIRYIRLHRAWDLLKQNAGTISEIAYTVGFRSPAYFTKCFHEQFALLPSDVQKQTPRTKSQ
jgi:signal transduction histidine kinase/ligand-binding sensor domain-containing protein/DNA-binding response OmpR family regulator